VIAIAAAGGDDGGLAHTVALKSDGTVITWGNNDYGQTNVPAGLGGVTAIAAGGYDTAALIGIAIPLTAQRNGNELILSWPVNAVRFTLQSTPQLIAPTTWTDVTNVAVLLGTQWTVTNTFSGSAQFYRLRKT
jgi:hypothetical protein